RGINEHTGVYAKLNRKLEDRDLLDCLLHAIAGPDGFLAQKFEPKQVFEDSGAAALDVLAAVIAKIGYRVTRRRDEEHGLNELVLERNGNENKVCINWTLLSSAEWQRLIHIHREISAIEKPPFTVRENGRVVELGSKEEMLEHVLNLGKKD